jgi:hypothetical protein
MPLNRGEGNGVSYAGRTSQNTARTARIIDNIVICRTFMRSALTAIITRVHRDHRHLSTFPATPASVFRRALAADLF